MNARLYDPLLGRHSSPDPTVPDPGNGQSFNRYTYVLNNALFFTDPTGLVPRSQMPCGGEQPCSVVFSNPDSPRPNAYLSKAIEAAGGAGQLAGLVSEGLYPAIGDASGMTGGVTEIMNQAAAEEAAARTACTGACQIPGFNTTAQQPAAPQSVLGWISDNILEKAAQATEPLTGLPGGAVVPGALKAGIAGIAIIRAEKVIVEASAVLKAEVLAANRLARTSNEVLNLAIKAGPERMAGFTIGGARQMVGSTFQRDVLRIATDAGPGRGSNRGLLRAMESEALSAGATSIRIVGHEIQNATWFRNAGLAEKMGYQFNKISDTSFELVKGLK